MHSYVKVAFCIIIQFFATSNLDAVVHDIAKSSVEHDEHLILADDYGDVCAIEHP